MQEKRSIGPTMAALLLAITPAAAWPQEAPASPARPQMPVATDRKVDIGGRELAYRCEGEGSPTVVIETGLGDPGVSWLGLLPRLAEHTQACLYSRAGLGESDPPRPGPRAVEHVVEELQALLVAAGIGGPYVLVGHSLGGVHVRAYTARFPEDVVGMVLLDSSHEEMAALAEAIAPPSLAEYREATRQLRAQRPVEGIVDLGDYLAAVGRPQRLGNIPLIVMSSTERPDPSAMLARMPKNIQQLYEANRETIESSTAASRVLMRHLVRDLAVLSSQGRYVEVEDAGHFIHRDQPDRVLEAIREVVEAARSVPAPGR
ncbi:MAG: alpha/beta hydrolase [Acidobacteriota bacterium]